MQKQRKDRRFLTVTGTALGMGFLAFLLPVLCFGGAIEHVEVLPPLPSAAQTKEVPPSASAAVSTLDSERMVQVLEADGSVTEMNMEQYLWGVVAAEMPASFELEALKAQAVAARTYTLWKSLHNSNHPGTDVCKDYACCQAWISEEQAAANWGTQSEVYAQRIAAAVEETDGMVLCWEGQPVQAVFHSSSAGRTEDAVAVWGSTVPYLVGVETPEGEEVPNYHSSVTRTVEEISAILTDLGCVLDEDPSTWFQTITYTSNGSVDSINLGGQKISGTTLRTVLGLRSAKFQVTHTPDGFTFSVTGYGHGVGMSQYGANALAVQGKNWREIVAWYYSGISIQSYPDNVS